jgi:hypothetical protein
MDDRRRFLRLPVALPVEVSLAADEDRQITATSANVSAGGVYFVCSSELAGLEQGKEVLVHMAVPPAPGRSNAATRLKASAIVKRMESLGSDPSSRHRGVACQFVVPPGFA